MKKYVILTELNLDKKINKIRENCWKNYVSCRNCHIEVRSLCRGGSFNSDEGIKTKTIAEIERAYDVLVRLTEYEKEDYKGLFIDRLKEQKIKEIKVEDEEELMIERAAIETKKGNLYINAGTRWNSMPWENCPLEEYESFDVIVAISNEELEKFKYIESLRTQFVPMFSDMQYKRFEYVPKKLVEQLYLFMEGK